MPQTDSLAALASTAGASPVPTLETKSLYATDLGEPRPLSPRLASHVARTRRRITVGHEEALPHGTLRCFAKHGRVVVELRRGRERIGRALWVTPASPLLLRRGARLPEAAFSVEVNEFIGSPWHELDYTSMWTVRGLRKNGEAEACIDR